MSFFYPEIPQKEKVVSHHPWEKYIKDAYTGTYKYGHNSAKNPVYPPKKIKVPSVNRVKFTVIGNRVTKEFIYSINLIKGLHKYRSRYFDAPVIRGVTSVEWPKVWNDLKIQYGGLAYCLQSQVAVLINKQFLGGDKELKDLIDSKYVYDLHLNYNGEAVQLFSSYINASGRPCAYLQISVDDIEIGTMIFMLYADLVPRTCENFLRLCKTNKGGYAGTPVHRIVQDCWIQCGGFGIQSSELDCENFIVPHDRRGVLGMANDGRHNDCSTQFFVLLQPATWMAHKYVAFGQLIDGEQTLQKIEQIPTFYESPTKRVIIFKAGILNMECKDIMINRGTNQYITGHIENLFTIGELFYEALLEKVFLEADFRSLHRLQGEIAGEGAEAEGVEVTPEEAAKNLRETQRFMRKKEEIDKQIEKSQGSGKGSPGVDKGENNDFDVEEYEYEPEEYSYKHVSVIASTSVEVKPEKPFYIPLTDVPYPGEVDSTYDLKKLLQGDYCLEADLDKEASKKRKPDKGRLSFPSELFDALFDKTPSTESESQETLDSEDEKEIKKYLKHNADRVSFAGDTVKTMAKKGKINIFDNQRKSELIPDELLRRIRLATEYKAHREKKVSIVPTVAIDTHKEIKRRQTGFVRKEDLARIRRFQKESAELDDDEDDEDEEDAHEPYTRQVTVGEQPPTALEKSKIKRRQTGFVRPDDLEKNHVINKTSSELLLDQLDEEESPKVRMVRETTPKAQTQGTRAMRRPTTFIRPGQYVLDDDEDDDVHYHDESDDEGQRPSVLLRLYDDVFIDNLGPGPTLKDYKPMSEIQQSKAVFLTRSPARRIKNEIDVREKFKRRSLSLELEDKSIDQVLLLQHGKKVYRKISSDYVRTIDHIEHKEENSIRSVEFAKTRPAISVREYQKKNQQYQELLTKSKLALAMADESKLHATPGNDRNKFRGLRMPGDTPLYNSLIEIPHHHHHT